MSCDVVQSNGVSGNTQLTETRVDEPIVKKKISTRKHDFFTFNNYTEEDVVIMLKLFNEVCFMYVFQEETGENGNKHLQGVLSYKKPFRNTSFNLPKIHWEAVRNVKDAYLYCSNPIKRTGRIWAKNYEIEEDCPRPNYGWFEEIDKILLTEPNRRHVIWCWSKQGGVGKSHVTEYLVVKRNAVFLSKGKYPDIINIMFKTDMSNKHIVVFDLPRNNGNKISYDAVEAIKNGLICNTKFETGYKRFKPPHVLIFSNQPPDEEKLSADRWIIRRLDEESDDEDEE